MTKEEVIINDTAMMDFCNRPDIKDLPEKEQAIEWTKYKMSMIDYFFDPKYIRPILVQDEEKVWDTLFASFMHVLPKYK